MGPYPPKRTRAKDETILVLEEKRNKALEYIRNPPTRAEKLAWIVTTSQIIKENFGLKHNYTIAIAELPKYFTNDSELFDATSKLLEEAIEEIKGSAKSRKSADIFVVHGKNEEIKEQVTAFIKSLGLNPILLEDQPDDGLTIIEKLEKYGNLCSFALILMTGDDFGGEFLYVPLTIFSSTGKEPYTVKERKPSKKQDLRARQNVIFEYGYFMGLLNRKFVKVLYEEGVNSPSDTQGLIYTPLDKEGLWKAKLVVEFQSLDIPINRKMASTYLY